MSTENFKDKSFKNTELSKCPFTGAGTPAKFSAGRGQTVRDFWPNSLNLKILSQHSSFTRTSTDLIFFPLIFLLMFIGPTS